jgi:hypothetical protein
VKNINHENYKTLITETETQKNEKITWVYGFKELQLLKSPYYSSNP